MSHAHLFTRHSTCMGRLEHDPTPASSSPSSPDLPLFGFLPATSPVSNTRLASLKPPPLPFPTSKSKPNNFSNWNQRPALKMSSISSRGSITKMTNVSRRNTKTVVKTSLSLMEMDTDMDFERISLKKMPSSQEVSQKRRPIYTPQFTLHAEPLIISSLDSIFEQGNEQPQIIPNATQSLRMDCDETPATLLPCIESCRDALKRITPETMAEVLDGKYDHLFEYDLIDCRFPYEYEGGHIEGAINMITTHAMEKMFFSTSRKPAPMSGNDALQPPTSRVIILHCEFSAQRAPKMGLHLRNHDRNLNMHAYPYLDYPHVFILDGGYKSFFNSFQNYCSPSGYIEMNDPQYSQELKKYMGVHKAEFKRAYSTGFLRT
ncbi:cell division cycle- protein [Chytriomyces hyalinus]|nr:cell division cycle- protein [Chytriomyces hyalinus]